MKIVKAAIPSCFKIQNSPVLYSYMPPIATKTFNSWDVLRHFNTEDVIGDPFPVCACISSKYSYQPAGNIITVDLSIVENNILRELLSKGLKYREPKTFTWKQNSTSIMDSVEDYARCWANEEEVEVDTLPKGVESIASLVNRRLSILSATMSARCKSTGVVGWCDGAG